MYYLIVRVIYVAMAFYYFYTFIIYYIHITNEQHTGALVHYKINF